MAAGEVLFSTQIGTAGTGSNVLGNLVDGNGFTFWQTAAGGGFAGVDCGVATQLTRVRWSPLGGFEDASIAAVIQGSSSNNFSFGYQGAGAHTSTATVSATFPAANIAGHCLVVAILCSQGVTINTPTDSSLNTYTQALLVNLNGFQEAIYVSPNCAAHAAGNVVTVTFSSTAFPQITIGEIPDVVTATPVDVTAQNNTTSAGPSPNTATTGTVTTVTANDVLVTFWAGVNGPTGWTAQQGCAQIASEGSGFPMLTVAQVGAAGGYSETAVVTGPITGWLALTVALKTIVNPTNLFLFTGRSVTGTLLNEVDLTPASTFRFYAYISPSSQPGNIGDLDIIGQWTSGVTAQACDPVISPPGGQFDQPILVSLSCITTDAVMHYTLDGTTPNASSTTYTTPFTVSTTANLKVIAVSSGLSNSRVKAAQFYIPSTQSSASLWYPDNRGYTIWAVNPNFLLDPVSGYWYMYGYNLDQPGVLVNGGIGNNIYRSSDLRNWTYRGVTLQAGFGGALNNNTYTARPHVLYNIPTGTYVMWAGDNAGRKVYTASSPDGPFTQIATYTTLNGFGCTGDHCLFLDNDGLTAYICYQSFQSNISFFQLSGDFKTVTAIGNNYAMPSSGGVWGGFVESPHIFRRGNVYFLMLSGTTNWAPDTNFYWTSSSPTGPWGPNGGINPFATIQGAAAGSYQDNTVAYNTQNMGVLKIPGRDDGTGLGAYYYIGDAYNTGLNASTITSTTANFEAYTPVMLPIQFDGSSTMYIKWNPAWNFDATFPTVSGQPANPSALASIPGGSAPVLTWKNNETRPHSLYLDMAFDRGFTNVVSSQLALGTTQVVSPFGQPTPGFYRIRAVNASGFSTSAQIEVNGRDSGAIISSSTFCTVVVS